MVSSPGYVVHAEVATRSEYLGDEATCQRAAGFVQRIQEVTGHVMPVRLEFRQTIPTHAGLGSGTQLGLAIARALSELSGERDVAVETLAQRAGRGLRSAIGLHGFAGGGFLVDGGRSGSEQLGTLVARIEFPADWRMILVALPRTQGLSGAAEQQAFASQPAMPRELTGELCRIALMEWLPGLMEADFKRASEAMYKFGVNVGRFFEPVQGGVFADPRMASLAHEVRKQGFTGVAQTSWGPTTCVLCNSLPMARQLLSDLSADARWNDCEFRLAEPLNHGVLVQRC